MEDITPKLLKAIQNDFQSQFNKSKTIQSLYAKIRDGTATYEEANEFAIETGRLLSASFQGNLSEDILPDGRMYYNIANRILNTTLTNNHKLITDVTSEVQTLLNKAAGIGLKAIVPDVNESRIIGLINKASSATEYSTVAWLFGEPIVNFSQSIVDDAIRANTEFQYKSGLSPKIVRREVGNCCDWCKEVVGTYRYPDVPEGIYKRHRYCRCIVTYEAGKYAQDVHTKRKYDSSDARARIENSRAYQERMGVETQRKKAERKRQARLQAANDEALKKQQKESRIEYAKSGGKTVKISAKSPTTTKSAGARLPSQILRYDPDGDFTVKFGSYSDNLNTAISRACKYVAQKSDGKEYMVLLDSKTGKIMYEEHGDQMGVGGDKFRKFLTDNPENDYIFVHSHVVDSSFSLDDIRTLCVYPNIEGMVAARVDGVTYAAILEKRETISNAILTEINKQQKEILIAKGKDVRMNMNLIDANTADALVERFVKEYYTNDKS